MYSLLATSLFQTCFFHIFSSISQISDQTVSFADLYKDRHKTTHKVPQPRTHTRINFQSPLFIHCESATINWTDFLRAYTINPYEERNFNYVRKKQPRPRRTIRQNSNSNLLIYIAVVNVNVILSANTISQNPFWISGLLKQIIQVLSKKRIIEPLNSRNSLSYVSKTNSLRWRTIF